MQWSSIFVEWLVLLKSKNIRLCLEFRRIFRAAFFGEHHEGSTSLFLNEINFNEIYFNSRFDEYEFHFKSVGNSRCICNSFYDKITFYQFFKKKYVNNGAKQGFREMLKTPYTIHCICLK